MSARLAVDIGGTFTDVVLETADAAHALKVLTTTDAPERGVLEGVRTILAEAKCRAADVGLVVHGTTLATNALIERKGAKTGLVVTRGTRDVYIIGRGNRPEAYNLLFHRHRPLVPRHLTREVNERLLSSGAVHAPLDRAGIAQACRALAARLLARISLIWNRIATTPSKATAACAICASVPYLCHHNMPGCAMAITPPPPPCARDR